MPVQLKKFRRAIHRVVPTFGLPATVTDISVRVTAIWKDERIAREGESLRLAEKLEEIPNSARR
jgi:hypothetical protein